MSVQEQIIRLRVEADDATKKIGDVNKAFEQQATAAGDASEALQAETQALNQNAAAAEERAIKITRYIKETSQAQEEASEAEIQFMQELESRRQAANEQRIAATLQLIENERRLAEETTNAKDAEIEAYQAFLEKNYEVIESANEFGASLNISQDAIDDFVESVIKAKQTEELAQSLNLTDKAAREMGQALLDTSRIEEHFTQQLGMGANEAKKFAQELVKANVKGFADEVDKGSKSLAEFEGKADKASGAIGGKFVKSVMGLVTAYVSLKSAQALLSAADIGDQYKDLEEQFERTAIASGQLASALLKDLKSATDGAISNVDLFRIANKAFTLELDRSGISITQLAADTKRFADATGQDAKQAIDAMISSMATGRVMALASMGIKVDLTKAYRNYADSVGKSVKQLSESEKMMARQQGMAAALSAKVAEMGTSVDNAGDKVQKLNTDIENARSLFSKGVAESNSLKEAIEGMSQAVEGTDWVAFGKAIGDLASFAFTAAEKLSVLARVITVLANQHGVIGAAVDAATQKNLEHNKSVEDLERVAERYKQKIAENTAEIEKLNKQGDVFNTGAIRHAERIRELTNFNESLKKNLILVAEAMMAVDDESKKAGRGLSGTGDAGEKAAAQIAKLNAEFTQLLRVDYAKELAASLAATVKEFDKVKFDDLLPQFKQSVYTAELEKMREKFKDAIGKGGADGITEAKLAERAAREAERAGKAFEKELKSGITEAGKALQKMQQDLKWKELQRGLRDAIKNMDRGAYDSISAEMEAQFRKVRFDELKAQFKEAFGPETMAVINEQINAELVVFRRDNAEQMQQELERAFKESTDFFRGALEGIFDGGSSLEDHIKNMLRRAALDFGAQLLAALTGSFSPNILGLGGGGSGGFNLMGLGQQAYSLYDMGAGYFGYGSAATSGIGPVADGATYAGMISGTSGIGPVADGSAYAGMLGGGGSAAMVSAGALAGAAYYAYLGNEIYTSFKKGNKENAMLQAGLTATGLGWVVPIMDVLGISIGPGRDEWKDRRNAHRDHLHDIGMLTSGTSNGPGGRPSEFNMFGGGYGSLVPAEGMSWEGLGPNVTDEHTGLANLLSIAGIGEVDTQLVHMFANALAGAENLNVAMLTTQSMLERAGYTAEDLQEMLVNAYLDGRLSLEEFNAAYTTSVQVMQNDLPSLEDAWELLAHAIDGPPRDAIKAIGLTFQELEQEGITTPEGIVAAFEEKFPGIGPMIKKILDAGVTSFEDFQKLSTGQIHVLVNQIDSINKVLENVDTEVPEKLERGFDGTKDSVIRTTAEVDRLKRSIDSATDSARRFRDAMSAEGFGVDT